MSGTVSTNLHAGVRCVHNVPVSGPIVPCATFNTASNKRRAGRSHACNRKAVVTAAAAVASSKSSQRQPRPENVDGDFYVDHTCIDCDTCRWMDPATFGRVGNMSAVVRQPDSAHAREEAMKALVTCPTFSIHANQKTGEAKAVMRQMPMAVEGCPNIYHTGFSSADSFGSTAYLIVRDEGNILVDSPRFHPQLLTQIKEMGGAKYHFMTHQDDVAGHDQWHTALNTERIIHHTEANTSQHTDEVEHQLQGTGPWQLPDGSDDIQLIHVPGHTEGSIVLLYKPGKVLFSGDHFGVNWRFNRLVTYTNYSSDPRLQVQSMEKLKDVDFLHVLPGHGRRAHMKDAQDKAEQLEELLRLDKQRHP